MMNEADNTGATDAIVAMLADMYELETNDVTKAIFALGYRMTYEPIDRHG